MDPEKSLRIQFGAMHMQRREDSYEPLEQDWTGMGQSFSYSDSDVLYVCSSRCMMCGQAKDVVAIDTSSGEYGPDFICRACLDSAFDRYAAGERTTSMGKGD